MRGGASTLAWSYFEKLACLQNMSQDRSDTGTGSVSDPMPVPSGEITVEALLDTLAWAVNRFGQLATVISKVQEAATSMAASSGLLNPKLDAQHTSLVRVADGLLALSANIKVNSEHAGPMLAGIKALQKQMENCSWQISGSGAKLVNVSVKELLMSQGKNIGENTANTTKSLEILKNMYEGLVALNDSYKEGTSTMKESNTLLKELIEGQKMALRQPGIRMAQQTSTPEPIPPAPMTTGAPGTASVPAAFQAAQAAPPNLTRIPGTILPRPPLWPGSHSEGTPSTPPEEVDPVAPGFKRVKLADGSVMTIPKGWQSDPNL